MVYYKIMITEVIFAIIKTFLAFGVGVFARWRGYLKPDVLGIFSRFTIDILMSFMVFDAVSSGLRGQGWQMIVIPPAAGFGMVVVFFLTGIPCALLLRDKSPERKSSFLHLSAVNNFLFLPLIIVQEIWGEEHIALLLLMSIGFTIGQWTIGVLPFGGGNLREILRKLCNPNLAASVLGIAVAVYNIPVPEIIMDTVAMLGDITVPLMLVIIGAALPDGCRKIHRDIQDVMLYSLCRLVIMPLIAIFILKLIPLEENLYQTAMIIAMMPGSSAAVLIVRNYGGDHEFAGSAIVASTVLSLVTIPVMIHILF